MSVRCGPTSSWWKQTPTTPPESPTASSCASVRLRAEGTSAWAHACVTTSGWSVTSATSQNPRSLRWARSTRIPSALQARTSARPASVSPGPMSGEAGAANGTPCPNAFGRLHVMPSERSPRACSAGRFPSPGSIASAPSMCMTALTGAGQLEVGGLAHDAQRPLLLEREQLVDLRRASSRARARARRAARAACPGRASASSGKPSGCSREDREEAAREAAGASALEVEVALRRSARRTSARRAARRCVRRRPGGAIAIR